jgi:hypothetical protein
MLLFIAAANFPQTRSLGIELVKFIELVLKYQNPYPQKLVQKIDYFWE